MQKVGQFQVTLLGRCGAVVNTKQTILQPEDSKTLVCPPNQFLRIERARYLATRVLPELLAMEKNVPKRCFGQSECKIFGRQPDQTLEVVYSCNSGKHPNASRCSHLQFKT